MGDGRCTQISGFGARRITSSWSGPLYGVACAPHVRHFIVHTRRAGHVVARPLNCGVRRFVPTDLQSDAAKLRALIGARRSEAAIASVEDALASKWEGIQSVALRVLGSWGDEQSIAT